MGLAARAAVNVSAVSHARTAERPLRLQVAPLPQLLVQTTIDPGEDDGPHRLLKARMLRSAEC